VKKERVRRRGREKETGRTRFVCVLKTSI